MEINTERLNIREVVWGDLDDIFILESCPEVDEFNTLGIPDDKSVTKEHLRPFIRDQKEKVRKKYLRSTSPMKWVNSPRTRSGMILPQGCCDVYMKVSASVLSAGTDRR